MKLSAKIEIDQETREQIRAEILGQARSIARSEVDKEIQGEVARLGLDLVKRLTDNQYRFDQAVSSGLKAVVENNWNGLADRLEQLIEEKIDQAIAKKMKALTVWDAAKQESYIVQVVRRVLSGAFGGEK